MTTLTNNFPTWFEEGTRVVVASTSTLKKYGIIHGSWKAWPGEKGTLQMSNTGYWQIHFDDVVGSPSNRKMSIFTPSDAEEFKPISKPRADKGLRAKAMREIGMRRTADGWE